MPSVRSLHPEQQYWVIQPLVEAGLTLDDIRMLLFRLGFEAVVSEGRGTVASVDDVVRDQPVPVRAAWTHVIGRILELQESAAGT